MHTGRSGIGEPAGHRVVEEVKNKSGHFGTFLGIELCFFAMSDQVITQILNAAVQGDRQAAGQLLPLVYDELRKLAAQRMANEAPGQTLQATALVHDAYLRLVDVDVPQNWD